MARMSIELTIPGLIVVPLAAGIGAFVTSRRAAAISVAAAAVQVIMAFQLAGVVWKEGPLRYQVGGWGAPLGIDLYVDGLASLMLLVTAPIALGVLFYAAGYLTRLEHDRVHKATRDMFWPLCLFLWAALNALFLSADLFNLYVTLEMITLSAAALIGLAGTTAALGASLRYLLIAVVGSLFYLLGVALLYNIYGTMDWDKIAVQYQLGFSSSCAIALMCVGLLLKTALFPLHFWLPPAHANAPAPASALLSGLVLKAPFFVLLRLWFNVLPYAKFHLAGELLGLLGAAAIVWGSVQAIRQPGLKRLVAYSTVAQIGYLFLVFALIAEPSTAWSAWSGTVYFALSHACAKAAAFTAAGSLRYATGSDEIDRLSGTARQQPLSVFAFGLAGVSLVGLPPSGTFLAKWMLLRAALASGRWMLAIVILSGGLLAAVYVFRVVATAFRNVEPVRTLRVPIIMQWTPLLLALLSMGFGVVAMQVMTLLEVGAPFTATVTGETP